jgi:hypothetical protein
VPGGWEEFFRFIGEPYSGPLFPTNDKRNPFEVLIPKLIAATEKFDMIPVREKAQFNPQPWDGTETKLPGVCENGGYFLKDDAGEKFVVGGAVVRALASRKETSGRFSVYTFEAGAAHAGTALKRLKFEETHHAFYTESGAFKFLIDEVEALAIAGETTFVPAGTTWSVEAESHYAKAYLFANGGGFGEVLACIGTKYESVALPQVGETVAWDICKLRELESQLNFTSI